MIGGIAFWGFTSQCDIYDPFLSLRHSSNSIGNTRHRPELALRGALRGTTGALGVCLTGGGTDRIPKPNRPAAGRGGTGKGSCRSEPREPWGGSRESDGQPQAGWLYFPWAGSSSWEIIFTSLLCILPGTAAGQSTTTCCMRVPQSTA